MPQPANPNLFLGRLFDPALGKTTSQPLNFDPANLTTHAIVTGMTGSGKTGLCIALLEEAALHDIPAIIVDPKGDLTNLLLHFPDQAPQDFEPWLDPEAARRAGKDLSTLAVETAARWREGLAQWGLGRPELLNLQAKARQVIYTPGSNAGVPVNILASFSAPSLPWAENREALREKIATTVTALLGLIGLNEMDPLRSREHILLSNIMENAWSQGRPLDLTELILQTQTPPFARLGAFPVDNFFPEKERLELAMRLNNFLAAPSFQTWLEGQPLDIASLLYTPEGLPRQSIFYMAHLNDTERMFFTTLLFAAVEAWMRAQRGTSSLRALLYFDEILGFLPPLFNPPSKPILIRMLKQARAFGVGLLLATQNPVDVDYKALSNTGTWIIGRLQTEQDKQRLLDGLQAASGGVNVADLNRLISGLQKRVFVLHSVYNTEPQVFQSRWCLNYLAGPMMRSQIPALNKLAQAASASPAAAAEVPTRPLGAVLKAVLPPTPSVNHFANAGYSTTRPTPPPNLAEIFFPVEVDLIQAAEAMNVSLGEMETPEGIVYQPALLAQAAVRYLARRYQVDFERHLAVLLEDLPGSMVRWEDNAWQPLATDRLLTNALPQSRFATLPGWLTDARRMTALQRDFVDWVYRTGSIRARTNDTLKVNAGPDTTQAEFRELCSQAARIKLQAELEKVNASFAAKMNTLEIKLQRQDLDVREAKEELDHRRIEEVGANGELLLTLFSRRRRSLTTSLSKRRLAQRASGDLQQERKIMEGLKSQLDDLEQAYKSALAEVKNRWADTVNDITEVPILPQKKDIFVELYAVAWMPYYQVKVGGEMQQLPAFLPAPR